MMMIENITKNAFQCLVAVNVTSARKRKVRHRENFTAGFFNGDVELKVFAGSFLIHLMHLVVIGHDLGDKHDGKQSFKLLSKSLDWAWTLCNRKLEQKQIS